jgi:hypothetical protein
MIKPVAFFAAMSLISPLTSAANAQSPKVEQGAPPKWALSTPAFLEVEPPKDALVQLRFLDTQVRVSKKGQDSFVSQRFKILRPEALPAANLRFVWQPSAGSLTVHSVRLYRKDGSVADMLGKATFQIIQREENLEQSMLTGLTTAVFATPGVDVGDEVEFSATITNRDPTLGDKVFGMLQLPQIEIGGAFRTRLLQSDGVTLNRKVSSDIDSPSLVGVNSNNELLISMINPKSSNLPEGAPSRFLASRFVEYSSFGSWSEISKTFWKHFDLAAKLSPSSPIRAEIAKIANSTADPEARALAALKLVQDRIRYVYVGLGTGNYTPATADQTWDRRYGDCKGKTALLLAVLKELDISAEAVLVNQGVTDGIGTRLPSPGHFNHVIVRAQIGANAHWLDGTLFNSPRFANLPQPNFRAALALRGSGADLETILVKPLASPAMLEIVNVDASAGVEKPARIAVRKVLHGTDIIQLRAGLASLAGEDLKRALRGLAGYGTGSAKAEETSWAYDEPTGALTLEWAGTQKLDWEDGFYYIPGAGLTPPDELKRPKEQDQTAPWLVDFPAFRCWVTTIRLPADQVRRRWTYSSKPVDLILGGIHYFRKASLQKGVVQTVMSKRALQSELSVAEAAEIETVLPKFNNEKSYIYERQVGADAGNTDDSRPILDTKTIDWTSAANICQSPKKR